VYPLRTSDDVKEARAGGGDGGGKGGGEEGGEGGGGYGGGGDGATEHSALVNVPAKHELVPETV